MPTTLGAMLRAERKKRDLMTYDIAAGTCIMQSSIKALEEDDYDRLPAPGYVRGYILSYCRFLHVDPEPFLRQYEIDTGNIRQNSIDDLAINKTVVEKSDDQHSIPWQTALIISAVLLVFVVTVFVGIASHNNKTANPKIPPPFSQEASASATAPFTFEVTAKEGAASELTVVCDEVQAYKGTFTSGMKQTFSAQKSATLTIANPPALSITRAGAAVKIPDGSPATVTLKAATK